MCRISISPPNLLLQKKILNLDQLIVSVSTDHEHHQDALWTVNNQPAAYKVIQIQIQSVNTCYLMSHGSKRWRGVNQYVCLRFSSTTTKITIIRVQVFLGAVWPTSASYANLQAPSQPTMSVCWLKIITLQQSALLAAIPLQRSIRV